MESSRPKIIDLINNDGFVQWVTNPSEASNQYWLNWLAANPTRKKDIELAKRIIASVSYKVEEEMEERDYNLVLNNIVNYCEKNEDAVLKGKMINWRPVMVAASCVLMLLCFSLLYWKQGKNKENTNQMASSVIKTTLPGQKMRFNLPDGTMVMLNAKSSITYELPFTSNRELKLTGEAFFDVTPDKGHPFVVRSADITTLVLGTSFNVKAYPDDPHSKVAVTSGKVKVSNVAGGHALLHPDLMGVFAKGNPQVSVEHFEHDREIGWRDGKLIFEQTPVSEVFEELERWFGVDIVVEAPSLLNGQYTGSYQDAPLERVLEGIAYTMGMNYELKERKVIVNKK